MENRITQVLNGKQQNYLLPFLWMHGEDECVLREYMQRIQEAGIHAVCLESRPHPEFAGEKWWRDVDIIIGEARARDMKVWLLDDAHFPTGSANGAVRSAPGGLKRWHLTCKAMDIAGPSKGRSFPVAAAPGRAPLQAEEELAAVIIDRRLSEETEETAGEPLDLTGYVRDGFLRVDIPEGRWRIFTLTKKLDACAMSGYINMLEPESVRLLIDAVYEPHYRRYREEFGRTIAGFFSDEPGFYNSLDNAYDFHLQIGRRRTMPLPWSPNLLRQLSERLEYPAVTMLPYLWFPCERKQNEIRFAYMDLITSLYSVNFTGQIGKWCEERGVAYIGHVLEDGNVHARLGPGAGHYFRAMRGQHMSGIDVVLRQITPGLDYAYQHFADPEHASDGAFYHYGLAKLGASMAHMDPAAQGRAMCEIFGAYGWSEGLTLMKWLADHMLVRGINVFVPHAFSPKPFPDPDCPPHFYAHGMNPQYKHMRVLFNYMNRMCHLLNGGRSKAAAAVLYHAEQEWLGHAETFQSVGKLLARSQIDYDTAPMDMLLNGRISGGAIHIGGASYRCIFVPPCEKMTAAYAERLRDMARLGVNVCFIDKKPQIVNGGAHLAGLPVIPANDTVTYARNMKLHMIETSEYQPWLRYYAYAHETFTVHMFFNESPDCMIETMVNMNTQNVLHEYNALQNRLYGVQLGTGFRQLKLCLQHGEPKVFIEWTDSGAVPKTGVCPAAPETYETSVIIRDWTVSLARYDAPEHFMPLPEMRMPEDISKHVFDFSGIVRYEADLPADAAVGQPAVLDLGEVYEAAEVFINGRTAGVCVAAPYRCEIGHLLTSGKNRITVEVATSLGNSQMDFLTLLGELQPMGMLGPVTLQKLFQPESP